MSLLCCYTTLRFVNGRLQKFQKISELEFLHKIVAWDKNQDEREQYFPKCMHNLYSYKRFRPNKTNQIKEQQKRYSKIYRRIFRTRRCCLGWLDGWLIGICFVMVSSKETINGKTR